MDPAWTIQPRSEPVRIIAGGVRDAAVVGPVTVPVATLVVELDGVLRSVTAVAAAPVELELKPRDAERPVSRTGDPPAELSCTGAVDPEVEGIPATTGMPMMPVLVSGAVPCGLEPAPTGAKPIACGDPGWVAVVGIHATIAAPPVPTWCRVCVIGDAPFATIADPTAGICVIVVGLTVEPA
jgi:hypothetical protein